jgi:hypothetical protein
MHNIKSISIQFLLLLFLSQYGTMNKHKIVDQMDHELTSVCILSMKFLKIELIFWRPVAVHPNPPLPPHPFLQQTEKKDERRRIHSTSRVPRPRLNEIAAALHGGGDGSG